MSSDKASGGGGGYNSSDPVGHVTVRYGVQLQKVAASGDLAAMRREAEQTRQALDAVAGGGAQARSSGGGGGVSSEKIQEVRSALEELERAIKDAEA